MSLDIKIEIDPHQLEALDAGETRVLVVKVDGENIQKGDSIVIGARDGELQFAVSRELQVFRVHPGTKANGIMPGFSVLEVMAAAPMIEVKSDG